MSSFEVAKNIWEQLFKPPKGGIIIKENIVIDEQISSYECLNEEIPHPNIMSVMVTGVDTSEDIMVEFEKNISMLVKVIEERDYEIHLSRITSSIVILLIQVIHILSRILTTKRQLYKKINHKIQPQLHHYLFSCCK